jgi:hypothetical protein
MAVDVAAPLSAGPEVIQARRAARRCGRRPDDESTIDLYGRPGVYAVAKRQLAAKEIQG